MSRLVKCIARAVAAGSAFLLMLSYIGYATGARVNVTRSIPVGLYWTSSAPLEKGAYVMFCPPPIEVFAVAKERGYIAGGFCPGGYGYMMKQVLAVSGAPVVVTDDGVTVEGHMLPNSKQLAADPAGRLLPRHPTNRYTLGDAELLLMSDVSALSFDGRYFGPINRSQVVSVIRPILTW